VRADPLRPQLGIFGRVAGQERRADFLRGEPLTVLDGIDLVCAAGSLTALIGPSGCGKSTTCGALVPRAAFDLVRAYGATWTKELRLVAIPSALPWLFAAARLAVPRALLGVMIAEWLATGTGLGNLLNQSRGYLDYGMIWSVALVSVVISIVFYQVVAWLESAVLARLGMLGR
jgi:ABC-type proline/glycine betaine transport system permease subunit